jgi:hypothetical protein
MNTFDYIIKRFNPQFGKYWTEIPGSRNNELLTMFRDLGFKTGVEIGVERGVYSERICRAIPGVKLYCIDPWKTYPEYREHVTQEQLDAFYEETKEKLKTYDCKVIRGFSEEVYRDFPDESLDFIYIDGNHDFLHTTQDIAYWMPKVRHDGILAGHDFRRTKHGAVNSVKDVVPAYAYSAGIKPWFVLREPKGASSWFWIKK